MCFGHICEPWHQITNCKTGHKLLQYILPVLPFVSSQNKTKNKNKNKNNKYMYLYVNLHTPQGFHTMQGIFF